MADDRDHAAAQPPDAPNLVQAAPEAEPSVAMPTVSAPPISRLEGGDFDEMMKADKAAEFATTKANFIGSEGKDPERAAQVYNLSNKVGTDPSFVDRNYDKLKSGLDVNEIDFAKLSRLHPSIARLANDPIKAAAIRDQVTTLSQVDNTVQDHTLLEDAYNIVGYGVSKLAADASKIPAAMYDVLALKENARRYMRGDKSRVTSDDTFFGRQNLATMTLEEMATSFRDKLPILNESTHDAFLKTVHSAANASLPERMVDAVTQGDYIRGGQVLFAQTAAFVPTLVAMAGAAMVNPALAPAMFGATSLAEHNAQNLEAGLDPLQGTPNAMVHGAVAGYFTQFGVNAYFGTLAKRLSTSYGPEVATQVMKSFGGSLLRATGAEAGTMAGMSLADDFADYAMKVNPDALQGAIGRAVDAGLMGGLMGGATHGIGEAVVKSHELRRATAVRDFMSELIERSKNKVSERSPELHSEFVKDSVSGTDAESVQISPQAIETYFQSKNVNPVKAMQDLGFLEQFGHAKETGTNVIIPSEKFVQYVAKNGYEELVNDVKFNEEDQSVNEINAQAALEASFNKVDEEGIRSDEEIPLEPGLDRRGLRPDQAAEDQAEQIRREFARQLTDAGQDPTQAIVLSKIFQTQAERVGVQPLDLYNQYLVRIKGEGPIQEGRSFEQGVRSGLEETLSEAPGGEAGARPGDGGRPGALSEALRDGAEKLPKLPANSPGGVAGVRDRARAYVESRGREYRRQSEYVTADPERGARIAEEYERMEHRPNDPDVKEAYDTLINETVDQYQSIKESGLKVEAIKPGQENPYPNGSVDMMNDIKSGHLWFFPTDQGFGTEGEQASDNPLLRMTEETLADGTKLKANDVFRIVHDYYGHAKEGVSFGSSGEENAWQSHVRMYSDLAARAMTTETRGQNSWVNFGSKGEANRADPSNTTFAAQKTGLLPAWVMTEGLDQGRRTLFQTDLPRPAVDPLGFFSQVDAELGKMDFKAIPANDLLNRIKNIQGIKKEELEALGLEDYLKLRAEEGAKVTKDEVQQFVRDNGLKIEQVVLAEDYEGLNEVAGADWGDTNRDMSNRSDDIYSETENAEGPDSEEWETEKAEFINENREEYTDEDGEVDESGLQSAWERKHEDLVYERAEEYVDSDDYHGAHYSLTEQTTRTRIFGSDETGWTDEDGNDLGYNQNEAMIKHVANLIEKGELGGSVSDAIKPEMIEWREPTASVRPGEGTQNRKVKELTSANRERYEAQSREQYPEQYTEDVPAEKQKTLLEDDVDMYARREATEFFDDPTNPDNTVQIKIKGSLIDGTITGNNVEGYTFKVYGKKTRTAGGGSSRNVRLEERLEGKTPELAQAEAIKLLQANGFIAKDPTPADGSTNVNEPTGSSKFERYAVDGATNYREILLKLPDNREGGDFQYTSHFQQKNILAHVRLSDRTSVRPLEDTGPLQVQADRLSANAQRFADAGVTPASVAQGLGSFDADTREAVIASVRSAVGDQKVRRSIIELIPVDVVNEISASEFSPEFLLGNQSMLTDTLSGNADAAVRLSPRSVGALVRTVADFVAKEARSAADLIRLAHERNAAMSAEDLHKPRRILFIEELQSDMHQQGRERGYKSEGGDVPDAPFKQTDAWTALALKRMLRMAVEEGYDSIAWTPADVHVERWGTDDVTWAKVDPKKIRLELAHDAEARRFYAIKEGQGHGREFSDVPGFEYGDYDGQTKEEAQASAEKQIQIFHEDNEKQVPHFLVGSVEQRGGRADGTDIEALARQRGELLERRGERVTTKDELRKVIGDTLGREREDRSLDSLTDRVWKQMESGDPSGALQPRAEGMKFFYDKVVPDTFKKLLKKIDPNAKIEVGSIEAGDKKAASFSIDIPDDVNVANGEKIILKLDPSTGERTQVGRYLDTEQARIAIAQLRAEEARKTVEKEQMPALTVKLTDALRKTVGEQGLSLFQNQDGTPRGQITFGKQSADIRLFANANRSTFFHEVGHFVVEMMKDMASLEDAPEQVKSDFAELMKFAGHEGGEITTAQHEKLARGFEEYIMEGKAPSNALARAFTRFKTWLVDVYKTLNNNDVELSDEVRAVFDRVLATDAEIEHARSVQEIKPLFTEGTLPKGVHERYMKAFEAVQLAAENELRARVMEDIRKEETDLYKAELAESVERVTTEVKKMPVYQALSVLQRGKTINDEMLPENLRDLKVDRKTLIDQYGEEIIQKLPKPVVFKRDGMHPDMVADLLGYESGKKMIEDFTRYPKMNEFIEAGAKADMDLKSPDLFKSTYMPELAMEAIHNDERSAVLRMELDLLREKSPGVVRDLTERVMKRPLPDRQLKEQMEGVIGQQGMADLLPNKYRVAERQAGRDAAKAFANGDFQAAFDAKTRELKNYQLFKAASEAKADVDKSLKFFKKLGAPDEKLSKTRDMNLVNTGRAILASYGIGKTEAAPLEFLKKMQAYDPQAFEAATYHVHAATEGGQAKNYKELKYGQFRAMADAVKAIFELAKSSKEIEINGRRVLRDQVVDDLVSQLSNHGDVSAPRPGMRKAITTRENFKMYLMGVGAALRRVEHWAHAIDGDDYGGVTVRNLIEPIKDAESKLHLRKAEVMKEYRDKVVHPAKDIFKKVDIEAPEIDYTFHSKSELLGALMHTGNESNFSKLLRGRGWGDVMEDGTVDRTRFNQMVDRLQKDGTLTKQDYNFLQGVWDMYEKLKPDAQKAHFKRYGYHFNEITNDPFQTPFGEYKGGYAPAVADPNISEDAALRREKESFGNKMDMTLMPTTGRGFTKSRVEAYAAPLAMDLRYIPMQIDKVLRFTYMEPVVADLSKVILDRKYTDALGAIDSSARSEMLIPWLQRAASQATTSPSGTGKAYKLLDNTFRKMRGSTGLNAMTLNVINAFHQTTGFSVAAALVEPRYIRDATIRYTRRSSEVTHLMHEKSEYMRAKESGIGELQQDIEDLMNKPGKIAEGQAWIKKNSYILQKFTAGMTEAVAWTAGYDKALAEGKSEAEAVKFGDSVVRRTQHSASPTDVARFGTGTPFQRLFTMYFDYFNNKANLNLTQAGNMAREFGIKKGLPHMFPLYVSTMMIPAIMTKAAYRVAEGALDENDDGQYMDDVLELFFHSQVDEALTSVPILGPMLTTLGKTFNDKPTDDRMSLSPAIELAARAMVTPRHVSDFAHGKGKPSRAIRDVFSLVGLFTGLPIQPLAKPIGYAADVATGAVESSGPLDYTRGLITGYGPRR